MNLNINDILETINMVKEENLDIRTVTMGISLLDCSDSDAGVFCDKIYDKITRSAEKLVSQCEELEKMYGIPIINKRVSVTPISMAGGALSPDGFIRAARTLDRAADTLGINFIGGFGALVQKGMTRGAANLIEAIPEALSIAKKTWAIAWQNVIFALTVKFAVMLLGLVGIASMWLAVFADSGVAMLCVLNSVRLLYKK